MENGVSEKPPIVSMDDDDDALLNDDELFLPADDAPSGPDGDPVEERFEQDIRDAEAFSQRGSGSDADKKRRMPAFVNERVSNWDKRTYDGRNFLHHLAYYECTTRPPVSLRWLMARAISKLPDLMGAMDKSNRTPLTIALARGNEMFVYAACKNQTPKTHAQFTSALMTECVSRANDREITCLHTALTCSLKREESRGEYIEAMCKFVPEEMFTVQDADRRTPLHIAVEYERCCKTQVGIVNSLLTWGPKALHIPISSRYSKRDLSVYQYHKSSRKQSDRKKLPPGFLENRLNPGAARDGRPAPNAAKADPKKAASKTEKSSMAPPSRSSRDKYLEKPDSAAFTPGIKRQNTMQAPPTPRAGDEVRPNLGMLDARRGAPSIAGESTVGSSLALQAEEEKNKASEMIAELLKLFYLRTGGPHDASSSLHFHGERDKELWFDFGQPKKLSKTEFAKTFGHLRFDSALQYVALPQVEILDDDDSEDEEVVVATRTPERSRKDMISVFEWLEKKGVKHIVKVIVDDLRLTPHSDEAIENALKPFNIEILDWRRLDLDPASLAGLGNSLREIHLQWSGRNTTLRAWSEKEGLSMIPTLEDIYITQVEGLESDERTSENLRIFELRLNESWPEERRKPRVHHPKPLRTSTRGPVSQSNHQQQQRSVDPHKWMQCMEEFASYFRQIRALREKVTDPALGPVKVALIDDGTDITHPDLRGTVIPGKSFHHYQENSTWRVSPYWDSASGHGTLMARLIHRVCPSAIIHAIKLQTYAGEGSNKAQIDPESAVRAIEYATELGAHIISMSWTIKPPSEPVQTAFDNAIHAALNQKGILMFCAASDQGQSADRTYPHKSNPKSFRIGAARSTGAILDTVGDQHDLGFLFPGHEVVVDQAYEDVGDRDFGGYEAHSGSSVAAALAAGLAALVTECVRLAVLYTDKTKPQDPSVAVGRDDLARIRSLEQMNYALKWIRTNGNTANKYIEVWNTFSDAAVKLKNSQGAPDDQLEHIAALARHFLKKM